MPVTKEKRDELRERLRRCYSLIYSDDPKKLSHLESPYVSESSPFLKALRILLLDRFPKKDNSDKKQKTGFSLTSLKRFFNEEEYLSTDEQTVYRLETFCKEIEKKYNVEVKKKWSYKTIFLLVTMVLIGIFFFKNENSKNEKRPPLKHEYIDIDPSNKGLGISYFEKYKKPFDSLQIKINEELRGGNKHFQFKTRIKNISDISRFPVSMKLDFKEDGTTSSTKIFSTIFSDAFSEVKDSIVLYDLPQSWSIELISAKFHRIAGKNEEFDYTDEFTSIDTYKLLERTYVGSSSRTENNYVLTKFTIHNTTNYKNKYWVHKPILDLNPIRKDLSFIYFYENEPSNRLISNLKNPGDEHTFDVRIHIKNNHIAVLNSIKTKIRYRDSGSTETSSITGLLTARKLGSEHRTINITNLPESWSLTLNRIDEKGFESCPEVYHYPNQKKRIENIRNKGLSVRSRIGFEYPQNLHSLNCSNGYLNLNFTLRNTLD